MAVARKAGAAGGAQSQSGIELRPDGWERFEKAVDAAARAPVKRRENLQALARGASHRATQLRVRLDVNEFVGALSALSAEIPKCPLEILDCALSISNTAFELGTFEVDTSAALADVLAMRLQPSERLVGLVAAARTRNIDRLIVKKPGHG